MYCLWPFQHRDRGLESLSRHESVSVLSYVGKGLAMSWSDLQENLPNVFMILLLNNWNKPKGLIHESWGEKKCWQFQILICESYLIEKIYYSRNSSG
jgi:hypothetical protein